MDTPNLIVPLVIVIVLILTPRLVLRSVGAAGDIVAQLFVPPDRALGWPHGVQESDDPWGWRGGVDRTSGPDGGPDPGDDQPTIVELIDLPPDRAVRGSLVVPVRRVHRLHAARAA
ncbi:MAG: hypothetical protein E6I26_07640 [Chloroflexi bacterium]|nr:MAG: hypothetical protein E6I26_07640 [Chloroflexota bacterium]